MSGAQFGNGRLDSIDEARARLAERLRPRRDEIENAIFARVQEVSDLAAHDDAEYLEGLRATVAALVDHSLRGIELGEDWSAPTPSIASMQAQRAARSGVGLETVLLRYAAGHRLLGDYVMAEADHCPASALRHILDEQGSLLERLIVAVSTEYKLAQQHAGLTSDQRHARCVERLLAGEPVDPSRIDYEFDAWHLGVIATGAGACDALKELATRGSRNFIQVARSEETIWAWLGSSRHTTPPSIEEILPAVDHLDVSFAIGEPGHRIAGWRKTHHQAQAALRVAVYHPRKLTRYADAMLLSAALHDETFGRSLHELFLAPLASQRDGGATLRHTLRCYLDCDRNVSSTAAALGIARHTVENHLRASAQAVGREIHTCLAELDVALKLADAIPPSPDTDRLLSRASPNTAKGRPRPHASSPSHH
jgi:PucR C-terminal helix-turn-helix domain/GGDEF-like domain